MASMLGFCTLLVSSFLIRLIHIFRFVRSYILKVHLHNSRIFIILFEFKSRLWYGVIPRFGTSVIVFLHRPSKRICHGDKEIGRGLAIGGDVTHVDEILPSKVDRAKIDHSSFVNKANFIESIIKRLSSLMYRNDGGIITEVCSGSEGTNKFKSCARVKTASGATNQLRSTPKKQIANTIDSLVPRGDQTSGSQSFTNSLQAASKKG